MAPTERPEDKTYKLGVWRLRNLLGVQPQAVWVVCCMDLLFRGFRYVHVFRPWGNVGRVCGLESQPPEYSETLH